METRGNNRILHSLLHFLKMKIQFVDDSPQVYEYPSETSLLDGQNLDSPTPLPVTTTVGHTVPLLSGEFVYYILEIYHRSFPLNFLYSKNKLYINHRLTIKGVIIYASSFLNQLTIRSICNLRN